VYQVAINKGKE